jgi:hypothetical protein
VVSSFQNSSLTLGVVAEIRLTRMMLRFNPLVSLVATCDFYNHIIKGRDNIECAMIGGL